MLKQQFDREKFKDVVHYIVEHTRPDELGRVKLHKTLYFADMMWFIAKGVALTGAEYRKQPMGPCASHLSWALNALETEGRIEQSREWYFGYEKHRFASLKPAPLDRLDREALVLLGDTIDFVCRNNTAQTISELSHTRAWESIDMGEVMPYHSAINILPNEIDADTVAWAAEEAAKIAAARSRETPLQRRGYREFREGLRGDR
jgi:hypothetical protein